MQVIPKTNYLYAIHLEAEKILANVFVNQHLPNDPVSMTVIREFGGEPARYPDYVADKSVQVISRDIGDFEARERAIIFYQRFQNLWDVDFEFEGESIRFLRIFAVNDFQPMSQDENGNYIYVQTFQAKLKLFEETTT
jgi:hypothetical protein